MTTSQQAILSRGSRGSRQRFPIIRGLDTARTMHEDICFNVQQTVKTAKQQLPITAVSWFHAVRCALMGNTCLWAGAPNVHEFLFYNVIPYDIT